MDISLILCTYNRSQSLPNALDSVAAQMFPASTSWEAIIVDNNSRDQTRDVVGDYCRRFPGRFRYVLESEQGLSRARNAGIREANGEIVAFIDDDVIAEPTWLQNLTGCLRDKRWAGAGGRILPPKGFQPPKWLSVGGEFDLGGTLALYDNGALPADLTRAPFGTNMAFRREVFKEYGLFRTDLGRCGNTLLSGEDTEFGDRLFRAGLKLRYEPDAVVHHPVPQERLDKRYFEQWWFDFGRTRIIERAFRPAVLGIPREYISILKLLGHLLPVRVANWLFTSEVKERFYQYCQVWMTLGEIVENARKAREPSRQGNGVARSDNGVQSEIKQDRMLP